ncbi:MAG: hypothetical protein ACWGQW_14650, partial [bacterium]
HTSKAFMGGIQIVRSILVLVMLTPFRGIGLADNISEESRPRNPFQTLSRPAGKGSKQASRDEPTSQPRLGLGGVRITEARVVGIISSGEFSFAILSVKDHFTYIASIGSRLMDGQVLRISESGVLFSRTSNKLDSSETVFRPFGEETQR